MLLVFWKLMLGVGLQNLVKKLNVEFLRLHTLMFLRLNQKFLDNPNENLNGVVAITFISLKKVIISISVWNLLIYLFIDDMGNRSMLPKIVHDINTHKNNVSWANCREGI